MILEQYIWVHLSNTLWVTLRNNSWIYYAPHADIMTILCRDKQPTDVNLVGVGRLSLSPGCKGYSVSVVLHTSNVITSGTTLAGGDSLSQIPLQYDCCEELGVAVKLTALSLEIPQKHVVQHLDDLSYTCRKVSELEKEIDEQEKLNQRFAVHHAYSIVTCIIVSIVLIYVMYRLFKLLRKYCPVLPCVTKENNQLGKALPLPEATGQGNTVNINISTSTESLTVLPDNTPPATEGARRTLRPRTPKSYYWMTRFVSWVPLKCKVDSKITGEVLHGLIHRPVPSVYFWNVIPLNCLYSG